MPNLNRPWGGFIRVMIVCLVVGSWPSAAEDEEIDVFSLSLEELTTAKVYTATLTDTDQRLTPASVTRISREQIDRSGARNLDELLEVYVPAFQWLRKSTTSPSIGIRGIISDRNSKILLLVNGRVMNTRGERGVVSERMLSMLGDIHYIEVVRGPGSAIYGPGAIAGVIHIVTYDGSSFEGTDVQMRQGFEEEFSNLEIRHGNKLGEDKGYFIYYGVDRYLGADQDDARAYFSHEFESESGDTVEALSHLPFNVGGDRQSMLNKVRHKLHLAYENEGFHTWLRYTKGGQGALGTHRTYVNIDSDNLEKVGSAYQQLTLMMSYEQPVTEDLRFEYELSFDMNDIMAIGGAPAFSAREDEYYGRIMMYWDPAEKHKAAFGVAYSFEVFGKDSSAFDTGSGRLNNIVSPGQWSTRTFSTLGEYQWEMAPKWHLFLGGRADKHTYTDWLFSPRAAIVFAATDKDTLKLVYNRSVRRADDGDIRALIISTDDEGETEKIDNYELRYERQQQESLWFALSAYYSDYDVLAWTFNTSRSTDLGTLEFYGLEGEVTYSGKKLRAILSHNYTKHHDFDLADPTITLQNVSASPYGFGDDLANWSNHNTKLAMEYDFTEKWMGSSSVRIIWGYPGGEDLADYNSAVLGNNINFPLTDGSDKAWEESVFLNMGVQYQANENTLVRFDALNVLGFFDEDLNKRNAFQRTSMFRNEAPAVMFTVRKTFGPSD